MIRIGLANKGRGESQEREEELSRQYRRRSEMGNVRRSWLDRIGGGKGHE